METSGKKNNSSTMRYAGLASQWMAMLIAAFWIGWKLDKWIGLKFPLLFILLPLLTLGLSLYQLIKEFDKPKK